MAKVWVLDTDTKGTGANMVPLEKALEKREPEPTAPARGARGRTAPARLRPPRQRAPEPVKAAGPLPPGHVRKKVTGEIGRVQAVDPKAGIVTVRWLKQGRTSTVALASVTRR